VRVRVKICGLTTPDGVAAAVRAGADALGFVFAESPRRVDVARAAEIARDVPPFVARIAVFRYPSIEEVEHVLDGLAANWVQSEPVPGLAERISGRAGLLTVLHDAPDLVDRLERDPDAPRRASAANAAEGFLPHDTDRGPVLLEGPGRGGRGARPDWERAARIAKRATLVLAGGLTPENVGDAVRRVHPYAVDVSSGVETAPGVKSAERILRFVAAVRDAERIANAEGDS